MGSIPTVKPAGTLMAGQPSTFQAQAKGAATAEVSGHEPAVAFEGTDRQW